MDYILNELSVSKLPSIQEARNVLNTFVETCINAKNLLNFETLRIPEEIGSIYNIELSNGYPLSKWLHDNDVDFDTRQRVYQIIANPPLLKQSEVETNPLSYYYYQKQEVKGFAAAAIINTLAVSFLTDNKLDNANIEIQHEFINEAEEIVAENIAVKHAVKKDHIVNHQAYFQQLRNESLQKCKQIWEQRNELFPNLVFCGKTKKQLITGLSSKYVHQIFDRLTSLNNYLRDWSVGEFNVSDFVSKNNVDCSDESDCTIQKYGDERKFTIADGTSVYFRLHIKTGDLRFHFYPDNQSKKAYIGYIGKHLNTCTG